MWGVVEAAMGVVILGVLGQGALAGQAARAIDVAEAKVVALQAVTHLLLKTDLGELGRLVDPGCAVDGKGPGQGKALIEGLRNGLKELKVASLSDFISVREVIFFTAAGLPALRVRFRAKRDLWSAKEVPAHIGGGLGCCVVAKELRGGREIDDEVYVLIVRKVGGRYKVVYYGNS